MASKPKLIADQPFKIIKNAPLPVEASVKYPFADMDVGDAFDAPIAMWNGTRSAAIQFGKRNGGKFSTRKIDGETVRCWRIA